MGGFLLILLGVYLAGVVISFVTFWLAATNSTERLNPGDYFFLFGLSFGWPVAVAFMVLIHLLEKYGK